MGRPANIVPFFRYWSPDMAYVLGYWWADGYMRIHPKTTAHLIEISSIDRDHLELMAQAIGQNYTIRKVQSTSECYEIVFCSKEMYEDISFHGGTPRKSKTIEFPLIPHEFLPHFVRGLIDGDGTLSWNGDRPVLQIYSGSPQLLVEMVKEIARATGIPAPNVVPNRSLWYVKWSTTRAKCLAGWLYVDNPGLALARKAAIAHQFLQWRPKKKPEQGTITDEMRRNFATYLS